MANSIFGSESDPSHHFVVMEYLRFYGIPDAARIHMGFCWTWNDAHLHQTAKWNNKQKSPFGKVSHSIMLYVMRVLRSCGTYSLVQKRRSTFFFRTLLLMKMRWNLIYVLCRKNNVHASVTWIPSKSLRRSQVLSSCPFRKYTNRMTASMATS